MIKKARIEAELTQQQMSDLLGIPKRTIENWETGKRTPSAWVERLVIAELVRIKDNK